jgi:integrase
VHDVEDKHRAGASERIDTNKPSDADVALYAKYLVQVKHTTMCTVQSAIASIADHLRHEITVDYNPCLGSLIKQMLHVLTPMATPAQQKKEISWGQLEQIAELADASSDKTMQRDACMFMLAYHTYLRVSEIVRMNARISPSRRRRSEARRY